MILNIISIIIAIAAIGICIWNHTRIKKLKERIQLKIESSSRSYYSD